MLVLPHLVAFALHQWSLEMRLSLNTLALLLCAASFATTTMAQSPERGPDRQRPEGPHADRAPSAEAIFDRLDANHDGNLSREEFQKGHERMRAAMAAHHRPEGPPRNSRTPIVCTPATLGRA